MKKQMQDGEGQDVPTDHTKTEPQTEEDAYEEQIHQSGKRAILVFLQETDR